MSILQYESKIWATADLLRGSGIKESEWPSFMMPFFALSMIESRLIRMFDGLKEEIGEQAFAEIDKDDLYEMIKDQGQGYNVYIFEKNQTLSDICKNDKSFEIDFDAYLHGFDGETKDLLGVDATEGEKFLDIKGVITKLKAKKVLLGYTKLWAEIDLKPFNNSEITTLEEHIKRKWADISAETAGEQYTPDDVIALIAEIIASKVEDSDKLLKIYDCTCGGGNLLFGVEDRINKKMQRFTQTFGQDWNDALYALAKIESRFRADSKIEHGNTLVEDKFYNEEFDVVIANPPYGVSWKGFQKDIENDKTERFKYIPSISDGQLLFMQHLISKMDSNGLGVVVHNGSTLFSGDAGSPECNIRKWMLDIDLVEAVVQLPTDEFFNTGIYTYLWILNKKKAAERKDRIMLVDASQKYVPLKKSKGSKRKALDEYSIRDIVNAISSFEECEYAKLFNKENFYYNKQGIMLTNIDENGNSIEDKLPVKINNRTGEHQRANSIKLSASKIEFGDVIFDNLVITSFIDEDCSNLKDYNDKVVKPQISSIDIKQVKVYDDDCIYWYDDNLNTLVRSCENKRELLGCGKIIIKSSYKKGSTKRNERIEISVELTPDYIKDYEKIKFHNSVNENKEEIEQFMKKHIKKPFVYLENNVGVEILFNELFYKPKTLRALDEILADIKSIESRLREVEEEFSI